MHTNFNGLDRPLGREDAPVEWACQGFGSIKLSEDEQHELEKYVSQGRKNARTINRARAYNAAALKFHGEFARLNIIEPPIAEVA